MRPTRPVLVRMSVRGAIPPSRVPHWLRAILGVPLEQKVLGANLTVLIASLAVCLPINGGDVRWADMTVVFVAVTLATSVSYALIKVALRPVKSLERIARKVSQGRVGERIPSSLVADPDLALLTATMNDMLDSLAANRKRMATLAADVVYAQEKERARVARDLHDSVAQTLAAANFQIAAAANQETMEDVRPQLAAVRELLRGSLEELRSVSRSLHPRVADDLGLPTALQGLADLTRQRSLIDVKVKSNLNGQTITSPLSSTLYRIAQEALRNIELHADAGHALISLSAHPGLIELEVCDDGRGLDDALEKMIESPVLANMRQRLSLAGGDLHIHSTPDCGTRVVARVRLDTETKPGTAMKGDAA
ncbi:MAG TPA: histidine kinase [Gemmatimonadaceae bacterium]|nr:histidine kinase [Gemmatimonadaceae bacterium]